MSCVSIACLLFGLVVTAVLACQPPDCDHPDCGTCGELRTVRKRHVCVYTAPCLAPAAPAVLTSRGCFCSFGPLCIQCIGNSMAYSQPREYIIHWVPLGLLCRIGTSNNTSNGRVILQYAVIISAP